MTRNASDPHLTTEQRERVSCYLELGAFGPKKM